MIKVRETFPVTVPSLSRDSGYHPELVKHLMPPPDHYSGTTPRWKADRSMPSYGVAVLLPAGEKEPAVKELWEITPSDIPNVAAWLGTLEMGKAIMKAYLQNYWSIPTGQERRWIEQQVTQMGGKAEV